MGWRRLSWPGPPSPRRWRRTGPPACPQPVGRRLQSVRSPVRAHCLVDAHDPHAHHRIAQSGPDALRPGDRVGLTDVPRSSTPPVVPGTAVLVPCRPPVGILPITRAYDEYKGNSRARDVRSRAPVQLRARRTRLRAVRGAHRRGQAPWGPSGGAVRVRNSPGVCGHWCGPGGVRHRPALPRLGRHADVPRPRDGGVQIHRLEARVTSHVGFKIQSCAAARWWAPTRMR
mmetsp:Transcript_6880/g.19014  ORF Transcript_6880/g.19014 Transcript_6880/m.19014 type:complete len:229 (+) Transcript_6880:408-1094(+)